MRYGQIRKYDISNGVGIRSSIFVTGCTHACPNCFNEEYQDFHAGELWTDIQTQEVIEYLKDPQVAGLTLLGGEPFQNTKEMIDIVQEIKKEIQKPIWVYSGYTWEELISNPLQLELLKECDILVDGRFQEELKDLMLRFRGSSNQRIIDIQKSLQENRVILFME